MDTCTESGRRHTATRRRRTVQRDRTPVTIVSVAGRHAVSSGRIGQTFDTTATGPHYRHCTQCGDLPRTVRTAALPPSSKCIERRVENGIQRRRADRRPRMSARRVSDRIRRRLCGQPSSDSRLYNRQRSRERPRFDRPSIRTAAVTPGEIVKTAAGRTV